MQLKWSGLLHQSEVAEETGLRAVLLILIRTFSSDPDPHFGTDPDPVENGLDPQPWPEIIQMLETRTFKY